MSSGKHKDPINPTEETVGSDDEKSSGGLCSCLKKKKDPQKKENEEKEQKAKKKQQGGAKSGKNLSRGEQSKRARENWGKLRKHIKNMRNKPNFLVQFLDDENEMKQENMQGNADRQNGGQYDERDQEQMVEVPKSCPYNLIIIPAQSSWYGIWRILINACLFWGYFNDPSHIAFNLSRQTRNEILKSHGRDPLPDELNASMSNEIMVDVLMTIDISLQFITAFQKDAAWIISFMEIFKNYAKSSMIFDMAATLPTLILNQGQNGNESVFWFKMIRLWHCRQVYGALSDLIRVILTKAGLNKGSVEKTSYCINLIIYLFSAIHLLCSFWIYVGSVTDCSWLNYCERNGQIEINYQEWWKVYTISFYWVITTLTTVGYGDFKGYTPVEYLIQMIIEFMGIGVFSFLMGSINDLVGSERTLQDIIDDRMEEIEGWLRKLEKSRPKNFSKQLYDCIKDYTEKSYKYDYCQIQNNECFTQIKPRIRHRLINALFGNFIQNFFYLFNDGDFEGGCEFTSDFLSNIYSRLYLPEDEIIHYGDCFTEMVMIQDGVVSLHVSLGKGTYNQFEFFILPTYSYFGDYQIFFDLKSQLTYKAGEGKLLITQCLKKDKLLEMMDDYPEAKKFYWDRAWQRRSEFRRRQKKFVQNLLKEKIICDVNFDLETAQAPEQKSHESELVESFDSDDEFNLDTSDPDRDLKKKHGVIRDLIQDKVSKFFHNVVVEEELEDDIPTDELEALSEDEIKDDTADILVEDNSKYSHEHAKHVHSSMEQMSMIYDEMSQSMETNLQNVQRYVHDLQKSEGKQIDKVEKPTLIKISEIIERLSQNNHHAEETESQNRRNEEQMPPRQATQEVDSMDY